MSELITDMDSVGTRRVPTVADEAPGLASAVSWAAILAGAAGAAALSMLLLILGTGLGFSAVSPWSSEGISAASFGFAAVLWLSFTQLAASGMGGYLAGRLRTRWISVNDDEVYFRDTAHGFLTWAIASLLTAMLLSSVVGTIIGGGVRAGAEVAGGAVSAVGTAADSAATLVSGESDSSEAGNTIEYYIDSLFRSGSGQQGGDSSSEVSEIPAGEVMRIFVRALRTGTLPQEDQRYIGQLIAQRTELSQQEAEQRVSQSYENLLTTLEEAEVSARDAVDEAREASAYAALWMFVTLLMGAFVASLMAIYGGRQRDA